MTERPDPLENALRSAFDQGEPEGPECHLCGSTGGPWLPDPSGNRWPSGAQQLICSRGCPKDTTADLAAKDSHPAASTLSSDVRDLLTAIRDILDVPYPVSDDGGRGLHVVMKRGAVVLGALGAILDGTAKLEDTVVPIRSGITRHPATYRSSGKREPGLCPPCKRGDCDECMAIDHPDLPALYICHYVDEPHKVCRGGGQ